MDKNDKVKIEIKRSTINKLIKLKNAGDTYTDIIENLLKNNSDYPTTELTSNKLQDIEVWIALVEKGQKNKVIHYLNRLAVPTSIGKSDEEWLKVLKFLRKQEIEYLNCVIHRDRFNSLSISSAL